MKRHTNLRQRTLASILALATCVSLASCATLIGLEPLDEEDGMGGMGGTSLGEGEVLDPETEQVTTPLCVEYCDTVMANCSGDEAVYTARAGCINTCNLLTPGEPLEPFDNTVECRLRLAEEAEKEAAFACPIAGPGGEGSDPDTTCGSNCEAWCQLGKLACPDEFALRDCEALCQTIPDVGDFNVEDSYSEDSIQCRLIHLAAAVESPEIHCNHARLRPTETCVADEDREVSCELYCRTVMITCSGDAAVYESKAQCMAVCGALELGGFEDEDDNTVGCRTYHTVAAAQDSPTAPITHCPHAGPGGDNQCGNVQDGDGPCLSYCQVLEGGCPAKYAATYGENLDSAARQTECIDQCNAVFGDEAAGAGSYNVVAPENTFHCRVRMAARAITGAPVACGAAFPEDGGCQ